MGEDPYKQTRTSMQALAEHVLSAALHSATGKIGLRQTPGGFGTPAFEAPIGERRLRVDGTDLVVEDGAGERREPITTLRAAAAFAGVPPGAPADVYTPATALSLDEPLAVDAGAAKQLADWYELTNNALEELRAEVIGEQPSVVQLWPEHFDLATTISEVNYGGSPGDDGHPQPYLYIGPFRPPPVDGAFWNEPFGASLPSGSVKSTATAVAFYLDGRRRLASSPGR